ncbi:hypothetical protein [Streptomyces sp. SID13031]|uniref:hypothetical protein n=1 Tax=Streptomyces sp. SID13031 TaxID=2706046 RepID=UPI001EF2EF40|nr:hypothetical protein [Streptomyces sp. SID13031]
MLEALKAATLADATDEQFLAFLNLLQPDESLQVMTADARIDPARWGTVPHTFVRLTADRSLPIALQDRLIAEADAATPANPYSVHTIDTTHAGFFYHPATSGILAGLTSD